MSERGSLLVSVAFLAAVAGLSAAALDISNWYRTNRKLQSTTDGAALAGAQALPGNPTRARTLAGTGKVTFSTTVLPNDTITVRRKHAPPSFFGGMVSGSRHVEAEATARAGNPRKVRWAAPIGVDARHPKLAGPGCPCWKHSATLDLDDAGPGAFRLIDLDGSRGGTAHGTLADWISKGSDRFVDLGWYHADSGSKFQSAQVRDALRRRFGSELLLPIYRETRRRGAARQYNVVGWAGFHLAGYDIRGSRSKLYGWFERVIWEGIQSEARSENDFGVRTIALIK